MGRLNHENTVVVPNKKWDQLALLTTDDTFNAPSSQLYMYLAEDQDAIFDDEGSLYALLTHALRITGVDGKAVDPKDAFNGANWSNDNNVFQAIRLEDLATDKKNPRVVYIADTGRSRVVPDPTTGRLARGPSSTVGQAENGRIFRLEMNRLDPTVVDSVSIMAQGDDPKADLYVPFVSPDNIDTSKRSLMVQEDTGNAKIWQYQDKDESWRVVATVNDPDGESSGIVDASKWFGSGTWILDVQGHGANVAEDKTTIPGTLIKRESGQVLLMKIPRS